MRPQRTVPHARTFSITLNQSSTTIPYVPCVRIILRDCYASVYLESVPGSYNFHSLYAKDTDSVRESDY